MRSTGRQRRQARRRVFQAEALDRRALLSVVPIIMSEEHAASVHKAALAAAASTDSSSSVAASQAGTPTPHEIARQRFVAKLSGTYLIGPGRYTDQSLQSFFLATGGSNQALHMTLQMRYFVSTDPTQPTTGLASLTDLNVGSTGNTLLLDLTAVPQSGFHGLPTQFTWTVDPASGGIWTNAGGFGTGQGTLTIDYIPGGKLSGRATGAGRANLVFQGSINTSQVTLDIGDPGNRPSNP
jgi:hypothetical protein